MMANKMGAAKGKVIVEAANFALAILIPGRTSE
jgi:hypothetical protein